MLSGNSYYHRIIRKNVIAFGTIFNDLTLIRYQKNSSTEIERFKVPLSYAGKETYITKLLGDPDLQKNIQVLLPRMSFEITGIQYDSNRKLSSFNQIFNTTSLTQLDRVRGGVPYNIEFELNIYARNVEDGTQIVEQILPYFAPDYTVSINYIDNLETKKDVPIILNNVRYSNEYEGGAGTVRYINWTLSFTMKTYFYGPVTSSKIIRTAIANTFYAPESSAIREFEIATSGNGTFKIGETVYQGINLPKATARGVLTEKVNNIITVATTTGLFKENEKVYGESTGAAYELTNIIDRPLQLVLQNVQPNPNTANASDDFGFSETITEFPDIT